MMETGHTLFNTVSQGSELQSTPREHQKSGFEKMKGHEETAEWYNAGSPARLIVASARYSQNDVKSRN